MEIPKAKSVVGSANEADGELPDKVDTETDVNLLEEYGHDDPGGDLGGRSPNVG